MAAVTHKDLRQLFDICLGVRIWAEELRIELRHPYWRSDLGGMCAVASYELFVRLHAQGIDARFVRGKNHCFVMVGNLTLDVTATQFLNDDSVRGVLIVDRAGEEPSTAYAELEVVTTPEEVLDSLLWDIWDAQQRPLPLQDESLYECVLHSRPR